MHLVARKGLNLCLFFQDWLQLVQLGLHGVNNSVGLPQLVQPVVETVLSLTVLSPLLCQQAGVQADQVQVALGAGVVPVHLAAHRLNYHQKVLEVTISCGNR